MTPTAAPSPGLRRSPVLAFALEAASPFLLGINSLRTPGWPLGRCWESLGLEVHPSAFLDFVWLLSCSVGTLSSSCEIKSRVPRTVFGINLEDERLGKAIPSIEHMANGCQRRHHASPQHCEPRGTIAVAARLAPPSHFLQVPQGVLPSGNITPLLKTLQWPCICLQ